MKETIKRGLLFVRNNQTIISSLFLIFVVVSALFLNSYLTLNRFQDNLDRTLRTKAVLAENIITIVAKDDFADVSSGKELIQSKLDQIQKKHPEIVDVNFSTFDAAKNAYTVVAQASGQGWQNSQDKQQESIEQNAKKFALSVDDAFAYLSNFQGKRFWNVAKAVRTDEGIAKGVLLVRLSLEENDILVEKTIIQAYLFSIGAVIIVLLLILNHIRLFSFEVKAKKLEEIDKMKDDFISMASHELKTPLTAILGYSELLTDAIEPNGKDVASTQQRKYLRNINVLIGRLNTLVEDLLDVSRLEQNRLPFDCREMEVGPLIAEIADELKIMAEQKNLVLENNVTNVPKVIADQERVKQIIINLLSNAIKYTFQGKVEIQSKEEEKFVFITVADTGMGISSENMKNLFSKFYRVKNSKTLAISGTGLGLWISKEIAQKMEGDLTVESIEGVGSHFTIKLKKA